MRSDIYVPVAECLNYQYVSMKLIVRFFCFFFHRDLNHKHIVHYFGASYKRNSDGIIWIMIMELCKTSLKDFYFKSRGAKIPGLVIFSMYVKYLE